MGTMALLALLLAGVGLGGFIASTVSERRREIGIRLALGAPRAGTVLRIGMTGILLTTTGLALGVLLTPLVVRALRGMVWGIEPSDPVTILWLVGSLMSVAVVSSVVPALRIVRLDPSRTLREP